MKSEKKPFNFAKFYRRAGLIVYDVLSIIIASYLALLMRYEFNIDLVPYEFMDPVTDFLAINVVVSLAYFYLFRLYNSLWAYAGETELQNLVIACVASGVTNVFGLQFFKVGRQPVPQSYYFLYTFILITLI